MLDYLKQGNNQTIEKLVISAYENNLKYLAITDDGNMARVQDFYWLCRHYNISPIIGCKITTDTGDKLTLLATSDRGYHSLMHLSTLNMTTGVTENDLEKYSKELVCLSGSYENRMHKALLSSNNDTAREIANFYKYIFKERFYIELTSNVTKEDKLLTSLLVQMAENLEIEYVASIKPQEGMESLFSEYPKALSNRAEIAELCNFDIDFEGPHIPSFTFSEEFRDPFEYLRFLAFQGLYEKDLYSPFHIKRLEYELEKIKGQKGMASYILMVLDLMNWTREQSILCSIGCGTANCSLICYCLGITDIDPVLNDLPFERFFKDFNISNIDLQVDKNRREDVLNYLVCKYGEEKTARVLRSEKSGNSLIMHEYGLAIAEDDISNHIPLFTYKTPNGSIKASQYTFETLEEHGVVPLCILDSEYLTNLKVAEKKIQRFDPDFSLNKIPENDSKSLRMIAEGKTGGIYLLESEYVRQWLKKIKPETWDEVMNVVSLCKTKSDVLLAKYMRAKVQNINEEPIDHCMERFLDSSHGILIYEEQLMQIIHAYSGVSLSTANTMRMVLQAGKYSASLVLSFAEATQSKGHGRMQIIRMLDFLSESTPTLTCKSQMFSQAHIAYMQAYLVANYSELL